MHKYNIKNLRTAGKLLDVMVDLARHEALIVAQLLVELIENSNEAGEVSIGLIKRAETAQEKIMREAGIM